ncbi:efflux RND transporter permease subunit [Clostridium thermobutyricum]|uniref:efflux RND transporter permease subunit n=1 Tax=Clostridium thermobutyricum TaxID=29372 RepID=UPI003F5261F4
MKISEFSIKRPITVFMGIVALLIFGIVSYSRLNLDMLPTMDVPIILVNTQYIGAGPTDVEGEVTKPLENVISTVSNVENVKSISREGMSTIIIQFADGTDMNFASLELREKVDMIKEALPKEIIQPMIMQMDPSMMPIMNLGVSFKGDRNDKIGNFADEVLKNSIESVEGVASVDISGNVKKGIKIEVDNDKLSSNGINIQSLIAAIKSENVNIPIGSIVEGDYGVLVRTSNSIKNLDDIKNIRIKTNSGEVVKLSDIANISYEDKKEESFSKIDGNDALILTIQKESTANTVDVSRKINKKLEELKEKNSDLEVIKIIDQGEIIEYMVSVVKKNAVIGGILAIIVLLLFLKDIRTTIIMGISIPISIVWTFVMVYFSGLTLNMISLGGIALGIGMLVDNSIVVIESIYRYKKLGYNNSEAALYGTKEVSKAIIASTITSICVFLPIVFVQGIAADIFKEMALTVTFSLISSLIVSFTLVPVLASKLLKNDSLNKENKTVEKLKKLYEKALIYSLDKRKNIIGLVILFMILGGIVFSGVGIEFFPTSDQGIVNVKLETPNGTLNNILKEESLKLANEVKEVDGVANVSLKGKDNTANMSILLDKNRKKSDKEIARDIRKVISDVPGLKVEVSTGGTQMSQGSPISISVKGADFNVLEEISNEVLKRMETISGIENIKSTNSDKAEEIKISIDKEKSAKYGLNALTISQSISGYFKNTRVMNLRIDDSNYEVYISPISNKNPDLESLKEVTVTSITGSKIPLLQICKIERGEGFSEIYRTGGLREVTISAGLDGKPLNEAVKEIKNSLNDYNIPQGYEIVYGGEIEQMKDAFSQMALALILAVLLVYMVMAAQFESLINPFIIMFTVPLAFIGAIFVLFYTGVTISIPAMIGFVMLTGIIVNNGIVLIDFINKEKEKGIETRQAIINSGKTRLQPILMTALTTIIGLLPMALGIGEGNEIQLPLAMTVIGGLTIGTLLTLIVIPVVYSIFDQIAKKFKRKK